MPPVRFEKILISDERYETAGVFDVNNNGHLDIVSGVYWYPGPDFKRKCKVGDIRAEGEYYDDFSTIPMDITGNGYMDFVTGGWWGKTLRWRENPAGAEDKEWKEHIIDECGEVETTRAWDIDGDGQLEIVPNAPMRELAFYKLITDENGKGTGKFSKHVVYDKQQWHGLGFGDITGNGRGDLVISKGWLESPEDPLNGEWIFHEDFDLGNASVPILVVDVNGNGMNDLIVGQAHGYGLDWYEQKMDNGKLTWIKHPIDPYNSQYHDMYWVDIDGDGECELVTGKRYRAHCGHDPGAYDPVGIYYFKWNGESFSKQVIDYGEARKATGCGIYFIIKDLDGNGRLDIVAPGKDGLYLLKNMGCAENMGD